MDRADPNSWSYKTEIIKPAGAGVREALRTLECLCSLTLPKPEGFSVNVQKPHLSVFPASMSESLGPIVFSSDTRRLYCYAVRYNDGGLGVLFVTGVGIGPLCASGLLPEAVGELGADSRCRGGIKSHTLVNIKTPRGQTCFFETNKLRESQASFQSIIQRAHEERYVGYPNLKTLEVDLVGWGPLSRHLPRCIFETSSEGTLVLRVAWGSRKQDQRDLFIEPNRAERRV